ncbi:hypothetical protein KI659_04700 [Litoribacter alkaliphilus]|uniref:Outer membrane beta-barrel protein n=1 Tax=Litoribacter ruber TaxID=702568 RepID=A0AAP2G112_9BACT|nr:hypothetical protein [Litoribacter alkaliphilus]MBS9523312.1 hypothetical protein [Litoribacter alkaliphilus]
MKHFFLLLSFFSLCLVQAQAQSFNYKSPDRPWAAEIGAGASFVLADNSFPFDDQLTFRPTFGGSLGLTRNIRNNLGLKGTVGYQKVLGEALVSREERLAMGLNDQAYQFYGYTIFADIAPEIKYLNRTFINSRSHINMYTSLGVGAMMVLTDNQIQTGSGNQKRKNNFLTPILPLRTGVSYRFLPLYEASLEAGLLFTFSNNIDGRTNNNSIDDHILTFKFKLRKLFSFDY